MIPLVSTGLPLIVTLGVEATISKQGTQQLPIIIYNSRLWLNSGYDTLKSYFANTSIPVFFSEYGCNRVSPRPFDEVQALFTYMTSSLSGGIVYEYTQGENNFGLVVINSDGSAKLLVDFDNLRAQFNKLNYTAIEGMKSTNSSIQPPACSASLITNAGFSNNFTLPSPPQGAQDLIDNGLKSPNTGKLITVSNTQVSQTVRGSNGAVISGLAIKPIADDQSNAPSGTNDTSPPSTTTSAAPLATTSKGVAGRMEATPLMVLLTGIMASVLFL
jgi:hypothetical protein